MTNAERFISSYNKIDRTLRTLYNYKPYFSFSEIVRKSSIVNYVVKKYEQKLIDYARLRNAIVHQGDSEQIIAEPHLDVVEEFEAIEGLICSPPTALDSVAKKDITTLDASTKLIDVIRTIYETSYSNIPILENNKLIGIANNKFLVQSIAKAILEKQSLDIFLRDTVVKEILSDSMTDVYYTILNEKATLVQVMDEFEKNKKLLAIIITKNGNNLERLLGLITAYDVVAVTEILDNYGG